MMTPVASNITGTQPELCGGKTLLVKINSRHVTISDEMRMRIFYSACAMAYKSGRQQYYDFEAFDNVLNESLYVLVN